MKVLTAAAMRALDRRAIEELGIPALVLMENAALGLCQALFDEFPQARRVAIVCGPGNNGGDGLALARHLSARGADPRLFLARGGRPLSTEAAQQLAIVERLGLAVAELVPEGPSATDLEAIASCDLLVDALFGTGLARPLEGGPARLVAALDALELPRLAVDLPSGLWGDCGAIAGAHLRADLTVTFGALKRAHVLPPACDRMGRIALADLGLPDWLLEEAEGSLRLLVAAEAGDLLAPRRADGHKGDFGHLLLVAGSPGKAGAAVLAARAAVAGGAGLVTVAVPAPLLPTVDLGSLESMTTALPATVNGSLALASLEPILRAAAERTAVALGPGLGEDEEAREVARAASLAIERPLLLDADGLNAWAGRLSELAARRAPTLLTPHPGELARLLGCTTPEVLADRVAAAERAAAASGAVVLLKGHRTLIAEPGGETAVNSTGHPAMASGGAGDVLTGVAGALLAQGLDAFAAARLAAVWHGLAGELAVGERGGPAVPAVALVAALPGAFVRLSEA